MNRRKYVLFSLFSIAFMATTANAAVCTPAMETAVKQAQYNAMKIDAAQLEPIAEGFMANINSSLDTIGCTDVWPAGSIGINLPSFDTIIRKAKEAAISKACSIAREKMNSVMGNISESVSFDVPGMGNIAGVAFQQEQDQLREEALMLMETPQQVLMYGTVSVM